MISPSQSLCYWKTAQRNAGNSQVPSGIWTRSRMWAAKSLRFNFLPCYGTRWLFSNITDALHQCFSWVSSYIHKLRARICLNVTSSLILSSRPLLSLPIGLFLCRFRTKMLHLFIVSTLLATCPAHIFLFDLITLTISYCVKVRITLELLLM